MRIERLKRWHWMIVGALLGCAMAAVKLWGGVAEPDQTQTVEPHVFEDQLITGNDPSRKPPLQVGLVVLHPEAEVIVPGSRDPEQREVITYYVWYPVKRTEKGEVIAEPEPRRVVLTRAGQKSNLGDISRLSGAEYLLKLKNHIQKLDKGKYRFAQNFEFKYAWMETAKGAFTAYGLGGVLFVGLLWPTIMNLLVGAGYGRPPVDPDEQYLSRFKGTSAPVAVAKVGVTEEDMAELARMEAELEAKLKDSGLAMTQPMAAANGKETAAQLAEKAARKFTGAAAEEIKREEAAKARQEKEFGADQGDYYPTEVHGKHKH